MVPSMAMLVGITELVIVFAPPLPMFAFPLAFTLMVPCPFTMLPFFAPMVIGLGQRCAPEKTRQQNCQ
jgi:hypothetical protein